jgi:hypothetical protein
MRTKKMAWIILAGVLAGAAIPPVSGWIVFKEIQHRLKFKVAGRFCPSYFFAGFFVEDASFVWEDRVELLSGSVKVEYNPVSVFTGELLRVKITSRGAQVRLIGEWSRTQGVGRAAIDFVNAELGLGRKGIREIDAVDVRSPAFRFEIKNAE